MSLPKLSYFPVGIFSMVGMPIMLLIFLNFRMTEKVKVIEVSYPSSEYNKNRYNHNSEFDTIDFNHPRGKFYHFSFSEK